MLPFVALAENRSDRWGSVMEDCQGLLCSRQEETMRCCIETGFYLCYVLKMFSVISSRYFQLAGQAIFDAVPTD